MNKTGLKVTVAGGLTAASLAACTGTGGYQTAEYRLPQGSTVELMQTLEPSPNASRIFIQHGVPMRGDEVSQWNPHCSFGLIRTRDGQAPAREIRPAKFVTGEFRIGVHASLDEDNGGASPVELALKGDVGTITLATTGRSGGNDGAGTPWPYTYFTRIALHSDAEPQVDNLTCSFDGGPVDRNLTIDEIRATLGDLVRIY